ncbi:MAG: YceI family protein [Bacteroidales bacterium]|nr:YceI family protein [Bacteroidales bacterium]
MNSLTAQKFVTKTGKIKFYSDAQVERIEAINNQVSAALNSSSGDIVFKLLIKSFEFDKALMQEHFNENYMESDKYPNSEFKGKITNIKDIDFSKDANYNVLVEGDLTIHGVTNKVNVKGNFDIKDNKIIAKSEFFINLKDYNIKIPNAVIKNLSETIKINVDIILNKLVK